MIGIIDKLIKFNLLLLSIGSRHRVRDMRSDVIELQYLNLLARFILRN